MIELLADPANPLLPVSSYGDSLLAGIAAVVVAVFPYAAAVSVFAVGVGLVKRWLGVRKATSLPGRAYDDMGLDEDDPCAADLVYRGETYDKYRFRHREGGYFAHRDYGIGGPTKQARF